ncbi:MAG TPA: FG-GAP-like repeat-containing protein [Terriglobia bacterium]|nr:FG-GAP-like repeat-containing protein [Terriglobia bacterium]
MELLSTSIERLRSFLLAGAPRTGTESLFSTSFRGVSVVPADVKTVRQDSSFKVQKMDWKTGMAPAQKLGPEEFSACLSRFLADYSPVALAQLDCLEISEVAAVPPSSLQSKTLRSRIRFELANTTSAGAVSRSGITSPSLSLRRQAVGEWEIDWEEEGSGRANQGPEVGEESKNVRAASPARISNWRIAGWRPLEITTVEGPAVVFTDVTTAAFGEDPSYKSHLMRDTNYWRAVLDEASGIDIFGNCGVSVGDADGDGLDEIYLCQPQGLPNRLYRQREPGIFEDVAGSAGVDLLDATSMALFADILNRGRQDLILITESRPLLFLNDGHGRFTLTRNAFPGNSQQASLTGAALADYNNDGFLDLYVCSYGYFQGQGSTPIPTPYYDAQNGPPNFLYRNRGDGMFEDATQASGLNHGNDRYSFACAWADFDDDGWMDLVVVNDFGRNNLYHNRRDGTFEEIEDGIPGHGSGMSACTADLTGERHSGLYVANMWMPASERLTADQEFLAKFADVGTEQVVDFAQGNALYRNPNVSQVASGKPALRALAKISGAAGATRGRWAWCSDTFDLENDGQHDLYVVNGFLSSPTPEKAPLDAYLWEEILALSPHTNTTSGAYRAAWTAGLELAHLGHPWNGNERNVFFLNIGHGEFVDASAATGLDFNDDGRSFAVFDYDGDGDADLAIHSRTGPQLRLLRNDLAHGHASLAIRLTGKSGNRDAIGARVEVETMAGRQVRWLNCGSGFLAQHSKELVFGLGEATEAKTVRVQWPGGRVSEFTDLSAGYRYYVTEGQQNPRRESLATLRSLGASSRTIDPPRVEPIPSRFSVELLDPLPMPSMGAMRMLDLVAADEGYAKPQPAILEGPHRYALLWLWDQAENEIRESSGKSAPTSGLEELLKVQRKLPSRLVSWGGSSLPSAAARQLDYPAWRANDLFRFSVSTILAHLFDYRRDPPMPTGLLFEVGAEAAQDPAGPASFRKLVKIYWGGADAGEILRDARDGVKSGADALPFPGRSVLCSFRRRLQSLGTALWTSGIPGPAEIYLASAVKDSPNDPDSEFNLALVRRELGKIDAALAGVRAALAARPNFPEAENLLGVLLSQSGDEVGAQKALEQATRKAPDFVQAWNNLGYVLLQRGDLDGARDAFNRALALVPNFPDALNNLGIISARQGDQQKAGELFHKVLELQPDNELAANNLGVLYAHQGKTQLALETFKTLLKNNPEAASVLYNLVRLDLSHGQTSEASALLDSWLSRHPADAVALKLMEQVKATQ